MSFLIGNSSANTAPGWKETGWLVQVNEENHKVGKRSALAITTGCYSTGVGVRMTADIYRRFDLGLKKFYLNGKQSLRESFQSTLQKYFAIDYQIVNGLIHPICPPSDELPTLDQFVTLEVLKEDTVGDVAEVTIEVTLGGVDSSVVHYRLIREQGDWKIDAINSEPTKPAPGTVPS